MATQTTEHAIPETTRGEILRGSQAGTAQESRLIEGAATQDTSMQEVWRADMIREQAQQRLIAEAEAEEEDMDEQGDTTRTTAPTKKISTMELAVVLFPAVVIDLTEFLVLFVGVIPFIGQPILGAYSAIDWILNGCIAGFLFIWMAFHGIWPSSPKGLKISALILSTLVGESLPLVSTIIPGWTGCAIGVFKIANSDKKTTPT